MKSGPHSFFAGLLLSSVRVELIAVQTKDEDEDREFTQYITIKPIHQHRPTGIAPRIRIVEGLRSFQSSFNDPVAAAMAYESRGDYGGDKGFGGGGGHDGGMAPRARGRRKSCLFIFLTQTVVLSQTAIIDNPSSVRN